MQFSLGLLKTLTITSLVIAGIAVLLIVRKYYERFTGIKQTADRIWHDLDDALKRRAAEISRFVKLGDAYITTTCSALEKLKSFERRYSLVPSQHDRFELEKSIARDIVDFIQFGKKHPSIKGHHYFHEIQNRIAHIQGDIEKTRIEYNQRIEKYNQNLKVFPYAVFAFIVRAKPYSLFTDPKDKIKFSEVNFTLPMTPL
ncbi:MAG: hypothetical protein GF384_02820 [Elusimicrobia bacterium]|nr:hypothetical protein [Elusimicrobiota bacterium]MBD3411886.1 hypothetical protein [Elusimicrobiota bacterium]